MNQISAALDSDSVLYLNLVVVLLMFILCSCGTVLIYPGLHMHAQMKAHLA